GASIVNTFPEATLKRTGASRAEGRPPCKSLRRATRLGSGTREASRSSSGSNHEKGDGSAEEDDREAIVNRPAQQGWASERFGLAHAGDRGEDPRADPRGRLGVRRRRGRGGLRALLLRLARPGRGPLDQRLDPEAHGVRQEGA